MVNIKIRFVDWCGQKFTMWVVNRLREVKMTAPGRCRKAMTEAFAKMEEQLAGQPPGTYLAGLWWVRCGPSPKQRRLAEL